MTTEQYYLTKLTEECAEVAQIALKTQQFGMDEAMPGQPFMNKERCHQELDDLMAIIEVLNADHGFGYVQNREAIEAKKTKVLKYLTYSRNLGLVAPVADIVPSGGVDRSETGLLTADDREPIYAGDEISIHQFNHEGGDVRPEILGVMEYSNECAAYGVRLTTSRKSDDLNVGDWVPITAFYGLHEESFTVVNRAVAIRTASSGKGEA